MQNVAQARALLSNIAYAVSGLPEPMRSAAFARLLDVTVSSGQINPKVFLEDQLVRGTGQPVPQSLVAEFLEIFRALKLDNEFPQLEKLLRSGLEIVD